MCHWFSGKIKATTGAVNLCLPAIASLSSMIKLAATFYLQA
jgi:hypothetical protein